MTPDQKIQILNAAGTWFAGIATFSAVLVALKLARRAEQVRIKAHVGMVDVVEGDGSPPRLHVAFDITNLGERPVTINSIGWRIGHWRRWRYAMQNPSGFTTAGFPKMLAYGEQAFFMVSIDLNPEWAANLIDSFIRSNDPSYIKTLMGQIHTSVGTVVEAKPEPSLFQELLAAAK